MGNPTNGYIACINVRTTFGRPFYLVLKFFENGSWRIVIVMQDIHCKYYFLQLYNDSEDSSTKKSRPL